MSTFDIPFAPVDLNGARLCDTVPPVKPPAAVATTWAKQHRLVAWRHDGGMLNQSHDSKEKALEAAQGLHYAIYWKWAIQCGRDMVDRGLVEEPIS